VDSWNYKCEWSIQFDIKGYNNWVTPSFSKDVKINDAIIATQQLEEIEKRVFVENSFYKKIEELFTKKQFNVQEITRKWNNKIIKNKDIIDYTFKHNQVWNIENLNKWEINHTIILKSASNHSAIYERWACVKPNSIYLQDNFYLPYKINGNIWWQKLKFKRKFTVQKLDKLNTGEVGEENYTNKNAYIIEPYYEASFQLLPWNKDKLSVEYYSFNAFEMHGERNLIYSNNAINYPLKIIINTFNQVILHWKSEEMIKQEWNEYIINSKKIFPYDIKFNIWK
jgi:hypothetical protein